MYAANEPNFLGLISDGTQQVEPQFLMVHILTSGSVLYCGSFMSFFRCILEPTIRLVFLGTICDIEALRFEYLEDKLLKLEAILTATITSGWISFVDFEHSDGKCIHMPIAVSSASLYTHRMYQNIAKLRRTGGRGKSAIIMIQKCRDLWDKFCTWLEVRHRTNEALWYDGTNPQAHRSHGRLIERKGRTRPGTFQVI